MQQIQQQIQLFHNLSLVCTGLCIVCLILSVFFFFKFNVPKIFNARTGRSVKKTIKVMEEVNARTGQLRRPPAAGTGGNSRRLAKVRHVAIQDEAQEAKTTEKISVGQEATEVLKPDAGEYTPESAQAEVDVSHGRFQIRSCIMLIHTDERI